jgi:hypothetical protein
LAWDVNSGGTQEERDTHSLKFQLADSCPLELTMVVISELDINDSSRLKEVSILVPCFNEQESLAALLANGLVVVSC